MRKLLLLLTPLLAFSLCVGVFTWSQHLRLHGEVREGEFASADGVVLAGSLLVPRASGEGPYPVIILLHGSGAAAGLPPFVTAHANALLREGVAVLAYDKRGSGRSGGELAEATYADFIEDALAALRFVRTLDDVDDSRVAVFGSSESGWFTPEIAARDGALRFIINRAGPPTNWMTTNLWEIRHELLAAGLDDEPTLATIAALRSDIWHYYREAARAKAPLPAQRDQLSRRLQEVDAQWLAVIGMRLAAYDQARFERYAADIFYDPSPYLERLDVPLLVFFASDDQNVPTRLAVRTLTHLRDAQEKRIELHVFEGYRHGMARWHNLFSLGYPPDYLPTMAAWARAQFASESSRPAGPAPPR
ncbi:MAG: alpha/beta fold hydrolase [Pseudomonadota bacterium]